MGRLSDHSDAGAMYCSMVDEPGAEEAMVVYSQRGPDEDKCNTILPARTGLDASLYEDVEFEMRYDEFELRRESHLCSIFKYR